MPPEHRAPAAATTFVREPAPATLAVGDWRARWIEPHEPQSAPAGSRPTHLLRHEFHAPSAIVRATLHSTAHGLYEAHLNGERVGDLELAPGYTEYSRRLQVQSYDVTALVASGAANALVFELADGWYRGKVGLFRHADQWGEKTALLAQLVLEDAAGAVTTVGTDASWLSRSTSHLADLIDGETVDFTDDFRDAHRAGADTSAWWPVTEADHGYDRLVAPVAPPVRRVEEIAPVGIRRLGEKQIVDLGQNINGWVRLSNLGTRGSRLTLTYGEALEVSGDVTQKNIEPNIPIMDAPLPAGQIDTVIADGDPDTVFEPRFSTRGFRYVRVEGLDHDLKPSDVTGVVVHSDLERTGHFECSDERINALHEAALWSFRGNICDIPTDCPTRERAGWADGWQEFFDAGSFLYDVAGFSTKWLRDVAVTQQANGMVPNMAPLPKGEGPESPAGFMNGSAGWGDAVTMVPWAQYNAYDDRAILEEMWPTMVGWIDFARTAAERGRHPSRAAAHPTPRAHERYLWDSGFHFGEWLEPQPSGGLDFQELLASDKGVYATAYYRHSTQLMAKIARVLGRDEEASMYAELSENIRRAWQSEFLDGAGRVKLASQANCVRALAYDLVSDGGRDVVAAQLVELVHAADDHVGTGFQATPLLLPALADAGHAELAYTVLFQNSWPSWLGMIEQGTTTMWERWEGYDADGMPFESHNHFSKGAVITFLHRYIAGIRPIEGEPAYRRFLVQPVPAPGVSWASGSLRTPHGLIESAWRLDGGSFELDVTVPPDTRCTVLLPDGTSTEADAGAHHFAVLLPHR